MLECQKLKMAGYISMVLNPSNSRNLEQLALKGLIQSTTKSGERYRTSNSSILSKSGIDLTTKSLSELFGSGAFDYMHVFVNKMVTLNTFYRLL